MSKIVIIGNSAAGFGACTGVKEFLPREEITVISREGYPAYNRFRLADFFSKTISKEQVMLCDEEYYRKNSVDFKMNAEVSRVDVKKKQVVLKDKTRIPFDYLIIASGEKIEIPDIPGKLKEGVFAWYGFDDLKNIEDRLLVTNAVCLAGDAVACMPLAEYFASKGKDVKVLCKNLPGSFFHTEKVELLPEARVVECIGEGELQAVKLDSGKVFGISLVIFMDAFKASAEFLKESGIVLDDGYVVVDGSCRTNVDSVWACGHVARQNPDCARRKTFEEAFQEGRKAAENILAVVEGGKSVCQTS